MKKENTLGTSQLVIISLLLLNILLVAYVGFFKRDALWLEVLKTGGRENFSMVKQLYTSDSYKEQQSSAIKSFLGSDTTTEGTDTTDTSALDVSKIESILADGYILGNKEAPLTVIEYSDLLCPFCKRHYNAQTVENLVAKYPDQINMVFRQFPIPGLHPTAPLGAAAVECVGKLGGEEDYYKFLGEAFQLNDFTEDNLTDLAKSYVKKSDFKTCLTSQETTDRVNAQIQEGQGFGVTGTPGNVIINRKTGKYVLIPGAYPIEKFEEEMKNIQ